MNITKTRIFDASVYDEENISSIAKDIGDKANAVVLSFSMTSRLNDPVLLQGLMTQMHDLAKQYQGVDASFKGIDIVSYDVNIPQDIDTSSFGEYADFFNKHRGEVISLPLHEVSVFEIGGKEVAGPLFSSILNNVLREDTSNAIAVNHKVGELLDDMLRQHTYEGLIVGMPYFSRWIDQDTYENARTQKVFSQHKANQGEWADRVTARDAGKNKVVGIIGDSTSFTGDTVVDAKSLRLLSYDTSLATEIRGNEALSKLLADGLHVLDESIPIENTQDFVKPTQETLQAKSALAQWFVDSAIEQLPPVRATASYARG